MKFLQTITALLLFLPGLLWAQRDSTDYYTLYKGGPKYPKLIRYLLLDKDGHKWKEPSSDIVFYIGGERFEYQADTHALDTLSAAEAQNMEYVTVAQLIKDEYQEHKKRMSQNGLDWPPGFRHYNANVFIVERIGGNKAVKYEVKWRHTVE